MAEMVDAKLVRSDTKQVSRHINLSMEERDRVHGSNNAENFMQVQILLRSLMQFDSARLLRLW